jgi:hypothetical protein
VARLWDRVAQYEKQNRMCAEIILANIPQYGGPESGLVLWARMVLDREQQKNERTKAA